MNGVQKSILNMKTSWLHHVYGFRVVSLCTLKFTNLGAFVKENVIYKNNICINILCIVYNDNYVMNHKVVIKIVLLHHIFIETNKICSCIVQSKLQDDYFCVLLRILFESNLLPAGDTGDLENS